MAFARKGVGCVGWVFALGLASCAAPSKLSQNSVLSSAALARLENQQIQGTLDAARRACESALADAPGSRMEQKALELIELASSRVRANGKAGEHTAVLEWAEPLLFRVESRFSSASPSVVCPVIEPVARLREVAGQFTTADTLYRFAARSCGSAAARTAVVSVDSRSGRCEQGASWAVEHWAAFGSEERTRVMTDLLGCMQAPLLRIRMPSLSEAEFKRYVDQYRSAHDRAASECNARCDAERAACEANLNEAPSCRAEYAVCSAGCGV